MPWMLVILVNLQHFQSLLHLSPTSPVVTQRSRSGRVINTTSRFDESSHSYVYAYSSTLSLSNNDKFHHTLQPDLAAQIEPQQLVLSGEYIFGL